MGSSSRVLGLVAVLPLGLATPGCLLVDFNSTNGGAGGTTGGAAPHLCGNGQSDPGEECEDGNRFLGDGCNLDCRVEQWAFAMPGPDLQGDALTVPFDILDLIYDYRADTGILTLGASAYAPAPTTGFAAGFALVASAESCVYLLVVSTFAQTYPVSTFRDCGAGWDVQVDPLSLDYSVGGDTTTEFMGVRVDPVELDPEFAAGQAFIGVQVFDETNTDAFPDGGFLVAVDWSQTQCGNGDLDPGEQCDDGNTRDGDLCPSDCGVVPRDPGEAGCGNTKVDLGEECDDGNTVSGDGCSATCLRESQCGNGLLEVFEECDDANLWNGDGCSQVCTIEPVCGNGVNEAREQCDDGNIDPGDGCSPDCQVE